MAASTFVPRTSRMPSAVIRIAAGSAKINVAMIADGSPMRTNSVIGAR